MQPARLQELRTPYGVVQLYTYQTKMRPRKRGVFVPAFSTAPGVYATVLAKLRDRGIACTFVALPQRLRRHGTGNSIQDQKASVLSDVVRDHPGRPHLIAHSEGAYAALGAATSCPKVGAVTLIAPAGLLAPEPLVRLAKRYAQELGQQCWRSLRSIRRLRLTAHAAAQLVEAILLRHQQTTREVQALTTRSIRNQLGQLGERIPVSILHGRNDAVFPFDLVRQRVSGLPVRFREVPGIHNSVYLDPARFAGYLEQELLAAS